MKVVREKLNKTNIETSAGIVIIWDNKILLAHPTNAGQLGSYSIPKGHCEGDETPREAAIRETMEEIGISLEPHELQPEIHTIEYKDKNNIIYKKVHYFIHYSDYEIPINKNDLQKEEIDYAAFFDKAKAAELIFWRLKEVLNYLT